MGNVGNVGKKKFCLQPLRFRGPLALGPTRGAISQKQMAMQPQTLQSLQCSTLVGGNVGIAYIAYMARAWGFLPCAMRLGVGKSDCLHFFPLKSKA